MASFREKEPDAAPKSNEQIEMPLTIDSSDVVKLILQYLKENSLFTTMHQLQKETGISLNTVDSMEQFQQDIKNGRWDSVLQQLSTLKLPVSKVTMLYEQIVFEMLESGERELARELLRSCDALIRLKTDQPERYLKLETLCKRSYFSEVDVYDMGSSKLSRRQEIAIDLCADVTAVEPSRLLALLGQAMKYQQSMGYLTPGAPFDVFQGLRKLGKKDAEDLIIQKEVEVIPRGQKESQIQCLQFNPTDGQSFAIAGKSGYLEIWDTDSVRLRVDLDYQQLGNLIHPEAAILSLAWNKDSDQIVIASEKGEMRIYRVSDGQVLKTFPQAHRDGILSVIYSKDQSQLLTASMDQTVRIHGLKSGKVLKEFRGHSSFVNTAVYYYGRENQQQVLSGSADGTVRIWDAKTTECLQTIRPAALAAEIELIEIGVRKLVPLPHQSDQTLVVIRHNKAMLLSNLTGQILQVYHAPGVGSKTTTTSSGTAGGSHGKKQSKTAGSNDFITAAYSSQGKWLYCASEDHHLYIFDSKTAQLEDTIPIQTTSEIIEIVHHPQRNLLAIITRDGQVSIAVP